MSENQAGAIIECGPGDWQIAQQDARGFGTITLAGRWVHEAKGTVETRLVSEDTGAPVNQSLDWQPASTTPEGKWSAFLSKVPAGGPYRLETRFRPENQTAGEWSIRGDMRHFLGIGDLWIIAGQSNSAGYGRSPVCDPPEMGVHLLCNSERWRLAAHPMNESTDTRHPVNRETANSGHSPYLHFGRLLKRELNHPIGFVQTALGGSPLSAWNPTEPGDAVLYRNMLHCVELAGGKVRGVLWYQGESDSGGENAASYADRFIKAVKAWRKALKNAALPVITVQLNRVYGAATAQSDRDWTIVRDAQRQVPGRLANVAVVPTFDLSLTDGIHISSAANLLLAERMARAALGMVYGRPVSWQAPDIEAARRLAGGREIDLVFKNVASRMDNIDPPANPFCVEDKEGSVPVEKVVYPQDARVKLVLGRALRGRAVVHGGYGTNPPSAPMDMERFVPMLGFYGVPVTA